MRVEKKSRDRKTVLYMLSNEIRLSSRSLEKMKDEKNLNIKEI